MKIKYILLLGLFTLFGGCMGGTGVLVQEVNVTVNPPTNISTAFNDTIVSNETGWTSSKIDAELNTKGDVSGTGVTDYLPIWTGSKDLIASNIVFDSANNEFKFEDGNINLQVESATDSTFATTTKAAMSLGSNNNLNDNSVVAVGTGMTMNGTNALAVGANHVLESGCDNSAIVGTGNNCNGVYNLVAGVSSTIDGANNLGVGFLTTVEQNFNIFASGFSSYGLGVSASMMVGQSQTLDSWREGIFVGTGNAYGTGNANLRTLFVGVSANIQDSQYNILNMNGGQINDTDYSFVQGISSVVIDSVGVSAFGDNNDIDTATNTLVKGDNVEVTSSDNIWVLGNDASVINNQNVHILGNSSKISTVQNDTIHLANDVEIFGELTINLSGSGNYVCINSTTNTLYRGSSC